MDAALLSQFEQQIKLKKQQFSTENRKVLLTTLQQQYQEVKISEKLGHHLELLAQDNTFTVTTGHQLCLMTGPLYFIYKILHVIKLSESLNARFPQENFVPVYWMASEDHDFEEIRSFLLFGQKWSWESSQKGAVGRFHIDELIPLLNQLAEKFHNHPESEIHHLLEELKTAPYAKGFFKFINQLFSVYGLVIIDADQAALKEIAWPLWDKDLNSNDIHHAVIEQTNALKEQGQNTPIESKASNLFLLSAENRQRITKEKPSQFSIKDSAQLSPNVVMRPLFQEWILPNLAYIGGPSEVAYWQQLPKAFETMALPFPLIIQRAGAYLLHEKDLELIQKLGFERQDFLSDKATLKDRYLQQVGDQTPDYVQLQELWSAYQYSFVKMANEELPQEIRMVEAELTRIHKQIEALEQRFEKARKAKYDKALKQIEQIAEKIQTKGQLQERTSNILSFCPDGNLSQRIASIYAQLNVFEEEKQWIVLP
ncbi:MAG: bacillithiol biosynthesis cysteine-adding enzyme BshC [Flavobacteriales bacterium]